MRKTPIVLNPITHSEPRNVASDVKRRDDRRVAAMPPPLKTALSKSRKGNGGELGPGDRDGNGEEGKRRF
jgi:hypothetical protein